MDSALPPHRDHQARAMERKGEGGARAGYLFSFFSMDHFPTGTLKGLQ